MQISIENIVFIDFEACSLHRDSWPIEIGLSWIEGQNVETWSSLIRPAESWNMDLWSAASQRIHQIPKEELIKAKPAFLVAKEAAKRIAGKIVASDAPAHDQFWAERLFFEHSEDVHLRIFSVHNAVSALLSDRQLDVFYEKLGRIKTPHRAGPDAERYSNLIQKILKDVPKV
jgi:DNA polymerase III epsilon subunit-like protein